jgi:GNAT superfamily N-acetyltransferase
MLASSRKLLKPIEQNKTIDMKYDTVVTDGIITLTNTNTTLGFVRFKPNGAIEYIFVQPMYRKHGLAKTLLNKVAELTGQEPVPEPPVSPLGQKLFKV